MRTAGIALTASILGIAAGARPAAAAEPPMADGYYVRPVLFLASDEPEPVNWQPKLQTCFELIQRFYAEEMQRNGHGYREFHLERNPDGRPRVFLFRSRENMAWYQTRNAAWSQSEMEQVFDRDKSVVAVMSSYGPWIGGRHVTPSTRGGYAFVGNFLSNLAPTIDGQMAVFCDQRPDPLHPQQIPIANASSSQMGGFAHELCHAFAGQHSKETLEIVSLGFIGMGNFLTRKSCVWNGPPILTPGLARLLDNSAFFRPETSYADRTDPTLDLNAVEIPVLREGEPLLPIRIQVSDAESGPALIQVFIHQDSTVDHLDLRGRGNSFLYEYAHRFPPGQLPVATNSDSDMGGQFGVGFHLYDGASNRGIPGGDGMMAAHVVSRMPAAPPAAILDPTETVWAEDGNPPGAGYWPRPLAWQSTFKASGRRGLAHPTAAGAESRRQFSGAFPGSLVGPGDAMTAYVFLDPVERPETISIEWNTRRAWWGADRLPAAGTVSNVRMGDLPPGGGWLRLTVPAALLGAENSAISVLTVRAYGAGGLYWDRFGKVAGGPADLVATALPGPTSAVPGASIPVSDIVENRGTQDGGASRLDFYLSPDPAITATDALLGSRSVPAIAKGSWSAATTNVPIPSGTASGTWYVGVIADGGGAVPEGNELNNAAGAAFPVRIGPAGVDLAVTALSAAATGRTVTVTETVRNAGAASAASPSVVRFYLSSDATITPADILLGERSVTALAAGASSSASSSFAAPDTLPAGPYFVGAIADATGLAAETDEANNARAAAAALPFGADLVVDRIVPAVVDGTYVTVDMAVRNAGSAAATRGFLVRYYLSPDPAITASDITLYELQVNGLEADGTYANATRHPIPANLPPGTYYVGVVADRALEIPESDETNNARASAAAVSIVHNTDLTIDSVSAGVAGSTLTISETVRDAGAGVAPQTFLVRHYLSTDAVITASDRLLGERSIPGLGNGATSSATASYPVPAGLPSGSYYAGAIADAGGQIGESNEGNNAQASSSAVTIGPASADLVVSSLSATVSGRSVSVSDVVTNQGLLGTSSTFYVRYYLSLDAAIAPSDVYLGQRSVWGLAAGASSTGGMTFLTATTLAPGSYYVGAIADATGLVAESSEGNNARPSAGTYPFRPDLLFSSFSAQVSSGKVSISNKLQNTGNAATSGPFAGGFYLSLDTVLSPSDILLGTRTRTSALNVGSADGATSSFPVPASAIPGDYWAFGLADAKGEQVELHEGNNVSVSASRLSIRPDLYGPSISASRSGTTLSVSSTVKNQGPLATSGSFRLDFYLSTDTAITAADTYIGSRTVATSLAYGASNSATTSFGIPPTLPPGSYRVGVFVDALGSIPEVSESNNTKASSSMSLLPDLVAVSVTASVSGRTVMVTEAVRNDGLVASPPSKVDIRLSSDSTIGASDTLLGQRSLASLAPGASSTATTAWTVPATVPAGAYYVGIWADGPLAVSELAESNNKAVTSGKVTIGP